MDHHVGIDKFGSDVEDAAEDDGHCEEIVGSHVRVCSAEVFVNLESLFRGMCWLGNGVLNGLPASSVPREVLSERNITMFHMVKGWN